MAKNVLRTVFNEIFLFLDTISLSKTEPTKNYIQKITFKRKYLPNKNAVLRKNKSKSIVVILPNVNDSLYSQILSDIQIGATKSMSGNLLVAIESNIKAEPDGLCTTKTFGCSVKWAWKNEYAKKVNKEWSFKRSNPSRRKCS